MKSSGNQIAIEGMRDFLHPIDSRWQDMMHHESDDSSGSDVLDVGRIGLAPNIVIRSIEESSLQNPDS